MLWLSASVGLPCGSPAAQQTFAARRLRSVPRPRLAESRLGFSRLSHDPELDAAATNFCVAPSHHGSPCAAVTAFALGSARDVPSGGLSAIWLSSVGATAPAYFRAL